MNDTERMEWMESKACGRKVAICLANSKGMFTLHAVNGSTKGAPGVRAAIDRAIEAERRKELGLKR